MAAADDQLLEFIRAHIKSVWALEILLLLRRDAGRAWSEEEVVRELRAARGLVSTNLAILERMGLAISDEGARAFRFAPANQLLGELCAQLAAAYRERPVSIINIIAAPEDRLQQLADAFRFKGGAK